LCAAVVRQATDRGRGKKKKKKKTPKRTTKNNES
jgi:hypothetical protein